MTENGNKYKVSVVIPMYNSELYILDAVESVLEQAFPCEIIIVDDKSTDDSANIALSLLTKQQNCEWKLLKNETNCGVVASRNRGVAAASGKYIAFLDSDDLWRGGKLRKQYELLEKTGRVMCTTGREFIEADGKKTGRVVAVKDTVSYEDILKTNMINLSSVMMRRDTALEFPMEHPELHEDYILWLKVLKKYGPACGINEPLLLYRKSAASKSGNKLKSALMHYKSLRFSGIGALPAFGYFISYAVNGVIKHGGLT